MAASAVKPHPEQIISLKGKEIELNADALRSILLQDSVKDKQVCVVSVMGFFRQGKSFLLNLLIRYLTVKYKLRKATESGCLFTSDHPIAGFPYKGGSKRRTLGIVMWSEVFLGELSSGDEIAIVLLDTQGSFDNATSVTNCAAIFALSTLISSVQIYNLKKSIKQYDLAHLECFSGYGQLLGNSEEAPFQNLVFLIRDSPWSDEKEFGATGGQELLEVIFNDPDGQSPDLVAQRENIGEFFKKISRFLLPHPGSKVATSSEFQGDLEDIDVDFKQQLGAFVPSILAPKNLAKTVNGEAITIRDLFHFIETYCSCFQNGEMPSLQLMFMASSDAYHNTALNEAITVYEKSMSFVQDKKIKSLHPLTLFQYHCQNKNSAIQHFRQKKIIANKEIKSNFEQKLEQHLKGLFLEYKNLNEIKYQKEKQLKKEQLENQQLLEQQQRMHKEQLRREKAKEQEEWKVDQLERKQSQLRRNQSLLETNLRSEQKLRQQQQAQYEEKLTQMKRRVEQKREYAQNIRREQKKRDYREKLRNEAKLRQQQELAYKEEQIRKKREQKFMLATGQQETTKRERRLSH